MLRELDRLEPELEDRRRELLELWPEREAQTCKLRRGVAQGHRAPPRAAVDEPDGHRDLSKRPTGSFGAGEQAFEKRAESPGAA